MKNDVSGLPLALASRYLEEEKACRLHMSFAPLKKGLQLLVPKRKAVPPRALGETPGAINLHATSAPINCLLKGDAFDTISRLLSNYFSIALDFFAQHQPNSTRASFLEAASRGPRDRGFREASLRVAIPLANRQITMIADRETDLWGVVQRERARIELGRDRYVEIWNDEGLTNEEFMNEQATEILDVLKKTPRPWRGSYSCIFLVNNVKVLSDVGSVTCRFEKLYTEPSSTHKAFSNAWRLMRLQDAVAYDAATRERSVQRGTKRKASHER
jgi:hypothetical protein